MKRNNKKNGSAVFFTFAAVCACIAVIIGLIPVASNLYYRFFILTSEEKRFAETIAGFSASESSAVVETVPESEDKWKHVKELPPELQTLFWAMVDYNEELFENGQKKITDPFIVQAPSFDLTEFGFEENVIGFIDIPRLKLKLPIYLGASNENMAKGAVHMSETSLPIGGENTNCVIAAHRGTIGCGEMFKHIDEISVGDDIFITNFCEILTYKVCEIKIISPYDLDEVMIQEDRDMITLFSCNPLGQHYERYVVYAERYTPCTASEN